MIPADAPEPTDDELMSLEDLFAETKRYTCAVYENNKAMQARIMVAEEAHANLYRDPAYWVKTHGVALIHAESQTLLARREQAGPGVAKALGITPGDAVIHWKRLRYAEKMLCTSRSCVAKSS